MFVSQLAFAGDPAYFTKYENIKMSRSNGILTARLGDGTKSLTFSAKAHGEFVDAFYDIARDRGNRVVILTGSGEDWMPGIDFKSFGDVTDARHWSETVDEGAQVLENIANIRVPIICAVNGKAWVHTEYCLLSNYIIASDDASFMDAPHFNGNIIPGDGIFTTWSYVAGPNRAQQFLLEPSALSAKDAKAWGVVNEIVPKGDLMKRANEIADGWTKKSDLTLRYTRLHFIQPIKERIVRDVGPALVLEGASAQDSYGKK